MSKHLLDEVDLANLERESYEKGIAEGKKAHYQSAAVMDTQAEYFSLGKIQTRIELLRNFMMEFKDQEILTVLETQYSNIVEQIQQAAMAPLEEELRNAEQFIDTNYNEPDDEEHDEEEPRD